MKVLYILMRNDLRMNAGRKMAQASHASNQFIYSDKESHHQAAVKEWENEARGFGTAIVLTASESVIDKAVGRASELGLIWSWVIDPCYGHRVNNEILRLLDAKHEVAPRQPVDAETTNVYVLEHTCAYIFGEKDECQEAVGDIPLHP